MNFFDWLLRLILGPTRPRPGTSPFELGQGPARLLIMRHGEKTGDNSDPYLSVQGQQRAKRLAAYIPQTFGPPDFLIAAKTSKKSLRPYDTLRPLADVLGLRIKEKFDDDETDALVEHMGASENYAGKYGVIAWRHGNIPSLLEALGAPDGSYPQPWDDRVFNLIIEMTFSDSAAPRLRQITEPF
jgi:hypothetical protein